MNVAILMSTYNGHRFLDAQLESLAKQTVRDEMTVYIRDDGSLDNTIDIVEKWKDNINIVLFKGNNVGPAMSFWKLFMNPDIKADYYAFCDQDDIWDTEKIECGIDKLRNNRHLYVCNCRFLDENGKVIKERRTVKKPNISVKRLFISGCTQGCSMVFTDALREYIMQMNLKCIPMHDIVLMLYALGFGEIYWDQIPHFGYRMHSNNVVAKGNKTCFQKIKTTYRNWKNSSEHSMADVAMEMLKNLDSLSEENEKFLKEINRYKHHRFSVIWQVREVEVENAALRSFCIRILLGLY